MNGRTREPISDNYGLDRGTPLDRHYIEDFLTHHQEEIRGHVLEVGDPRYTARFGAADVSTSEVLDIESSNPQATLVADLCVPGSLPPATYDCIILTQTMHLLREPGTVIENYLNALIPDSTLLLTAPALSRISPTYPTGDFWRFTPPGMTHLFEKHWRGTFEVRSYGNLPVCIGFLRGEIVEETDEEVLRYYDPRFPLTVAVHARRESFEGP